MKKFILILISFILMFSISCKTSVNCDAYGKEDNSKNIKDPLA